jgi:hypothetical protein
LKEHITRQRDIVKRVLDIGHPSELAETTLRLFEDSLRIFEKHRELILDQLKRRPSAKGEHGQLIQRRACCKVR